MLLYSLLSVIYILVQLFKNNFAKTSALFYKSKFYNFFVNIKELLLENEHLSSVIWFFYTKDSINDKSKF